MFSPFVAFWDEMTLTGRRCLALTIFGWLHEVGRWDGDGMEKQVQGRHGKHASTHRQQMAGRRTSQAEKMNIPSARVNERGE